MWAPPTSNSILVRGYTIGWGKGIPDEYTKVVDNKQRYFVIDNLSESIRYRFTKLHANSSFPCLSLSFFRDVQKISEKTPGALYISHLHLLENRKTWKRKEGGRGNKQPREENFALSLKNKTPY
jgi:hypothetical protein